MPVLWGEDTFRRVAGFPWSDHPLARMAGYQLRAIAEPVRPANALRLACEALELIQYEPDANAKTTILLLLDKHLRTYQANYPDAPLTKFYERLILVTQNTDDRVFVPAVINLGLDAARREIKPTSEGLFDWVVQRLTICREDYPNGEPLRNALVIVDRIGNVAKKHVGLVTPQYVEMCAAFMALPFLLLPQVKRYEQPHDITRRKRETAENVAANKIIEAMHLRAGNNLASVIRMFNGHLIDMPPRDLFSPQCLKHLEQGVSPQAAGTYNGVMAQSMLEEVRALTRLRLERTRPMLRLTYDPRMSGNSR